ncbi:hypothetical protein FE634_13615 [Nocardioides dongxiaopingii]|uniref:transglutaminase family protein n=1 Tax=Nocardioides sp. S-1144 TaxID=2582905 RepID=UPI0011625C5D|nr:DUF3488 and transglutaminase-like domain-containing protein [Nocardioides sp. S-1144]QCW51182.2 hypothetical protein FE634_13615 [Nocardioides sp. S-1144]
MTSAPVQDRLETAPPAPRRAWGRERAALGVHLRFAAVTVATTWIAMWSWRGFSDVPAQFIGPLLLVALTVGATGALARWRRLPAPLVVFLQALLGLAVVCLHVGGRPYPGTAFWDGLARAVDDANTYAPPVPVTGTIDVTPLLLVSGLVALVLVDLCAATLHRAPLAGLPLLTVYSVPVSLLGGGLSWWIFVLTAAGFLFMLFLQEEEHLSRWGRSLDGSGAPVRRLSDSMRASALAVGAAATAAAVLVPLAVPTFDFSIFDTGPGGDRDGDIQITNPMADLRRDLVRGDDIDLITVRTDDPSPDHLRISVLNRFTDNEWSAGDRDVPTSNLAQGELPLLEGVEGSVATEVASYDYDVEIADELESRWLPTQAPINRIVADGDWRWDPSTMDFLASDEDLDTSGMSYDMTAVELAYDENRLLSLDANAEAVSDELTELPDDFSSVEVVDEGGTTSVATLARRVTTNSTSDFEAAVLLQQWFRRDGGFTYDDSPDTTRVGSDELASFLSVGEGGRTGYCEQYSAAMGVMARTLGIPARVAVGFLQPDGPEQTGEENTYVYSAHDLHAWVELYFPGAGWVLFDPTPPQRVSQSTLPDYTDAAIEPAPVPSVTQVPEETRPTATRPPEPPVPSTDQPDQQTADDDAAADGSGVPWGWLLTGLAVVVVLVLLVRLPRLLRGRQRARRLAAGPEAAWAELRATALDLGRRWPEGRSPRETAAVLTGWFGAPVAPDAAGTDERPPHGPGVAPEAEAALARIVAQVERSRYARHHDTEAGSYDDDVQTCATALTLGATPRARRRAAWLPVSAFQRHDSPGTTAAPDSSDERGRRVEHI